MPNRAARRQAARRGQSIIIALLVLLLLGIAGGLFVTIIARNLINARRSARVGSADAYARAGITFADSRLTNSLQGADWRPPLQFKLDPAYQPTTGTREATRYGAAGLTAASTDDPDFKYLTAGYARYNTGNGRFLLRVTYDPVNVINSTGALPPGKYLKIESIGREGVIDSLDPTTYTNNRSSDRVQSYQVAYKPIGITDFARFETNPDKRSDIANLGVISKLYTDDPDGGIATPGVYDFNTAARQPTLQLYPVITTYGAPDAYLSAGNGAVYANPAAGGNQAVPPGYTAVPGGGSLQSNMSTRFFGKNVFYLNNAGANAPQFQDTIGIAGDILLDSYNKDATLDNKTLDTNGNGQQAAVMLNPKPASSIGDQTGLTNLIGSATNFVYPSISSSFTTYSGLVRDGSSGNDATGLPRSISRLDPPVTDGQDAATQLPRYKALAMTSTPRIDPAATPAGSLYPAGSAQFGYGRDIYVDNAADVQDDSQSVGGGSNLTDEWLHGAATAATSGIGKGGWVGQLYSPPGVSITLGAVTSRDAKGNPTSYGISLVRGAGSTPWKNPDGSAGTSNTLLVPYSDLTATNNPDNDIVIYADGNVRIHGVLSPNEGTPQSPSYTSRHLTVVSGATAYIEGNLLKGTAIDGTPVDKIPHSSISVLAHDYVCVNTTQFMAGPQPDDTPSYLPTPNKSTGYYDFTGTDILTQDVSFGFSGSVPYLGKTSLYISGQSSTTPNTGDTAVADIFLNGTQLLNVPPVTPQNPFTFGQVPDRFAYPIPAGTFTGPSFGSGDITKLTVKRDDQSIGDPQVERLAVLPMDIRIEAVLFAQTRSFFVIPGEWFNTDSSDNLARLTSQTDPSPRAATPGPSDDQKRFPMYGQPMDLKITIYGSVSEAHPADIAAQSEWMRKWGWIPQFHGSLIPMPNVNSTVEPAGHPALTGGNGANAHVVQAIGLQIIYDPEAGYPYTFGTTATASYYLRSDQFGRPLPFTPNLPVSTGLLYSGESGEPPLLQ